MKAAFTIVELLVVIAIIGILVGLLLPAVQSARESARQAQCKNNLKQLGLAVLNFESAHRVFPASGWTQVGPGNPAGKYLGWRTLVLPYLELNSVHSLYQPSLHWWEETNLSVASISIPSFECPSTANLPPVMNAVAKTPRPALSFLTPLGRTDYEAIQGVQPASIDPIRYNAQNRFAVMHRNSRNTFGSITDGSSQTIMVLEAAGRPTVYRRRTQRTDLANDQGIGWGDSEGAFSLDGSSADGSREGCTPANGCVVAVNARNDNEPYSFHASGAHSLFADGHVQLLHSGISLDALASLCTRAASDDFESEEWQ